jgi:hypothetical protein
MARHSLWQLGCFCVACISSCDGHLNGGGGKDLRYTPQAGDSGGDAMAQSKDGKAQGKDGQPAPSDGTMHEGSTPQDQIPPGDWKGYFPPDSIWYVDHSSDKAQADSDSIIAWLDGVGGFGMGAIRIDFSFKVLVADNSTPMRSFTPNADFSSPDCDQAEVPVPAGGSLEGEDGYACANDGDCHLLVVHPPSKKLYEMFRANIDGSSFSGECLAVWDMTKVYGPKGRGDQCTSADAAGFPITPLLFSADEVKAGEIAHAIRFILPNSRIRKKTFVRPATHSTLSPSAGPSAPPYGVHLRLKASVDISGLTPGAQVVARAMKKYGMFLSDGGNIALTAQSDQLTQAKWEGLLESQDLASLKVTDFEVIDHGPAIDYTGECVRE